MPDEPPVLSVGDLSLLLKGVVEAHFPSVWVSGEISNFVRAGSGHLYFTLKDDEAQLKAVMWRSAAQRLKFQLHDGLEVIAAGPLEVYAARGQYQIIVERMQPQGLGALELALRQLQQKLAAEGLFAEDRKRPLPLFPRRIALVTSPTGAAVHDMLQVITRRWPAARVVILPVAVQGDGAAQQIAAALRQVHLLPDVDVVITGRGGGSVEDLWAFNEEVVARAIYDCPIPVVSAVGHEIDVTIADLVADRRALTPSEAGELVVPLLSDVQHTLDQMRRRMVTALQQKAQRARLTLDSLSQRRCFVKPLQQIHDRAARLDELEGRLKRGLRGRLDSSRQQLTTLAASLDALSPLGVLRRGYSLTKRITDGSLVRNAGQLQPGDAISTLLSSGSILSRVERVELDEDE